MRHANALKSSSNEPKSIASTPPPLGNLPSRPWTTMARSGSTSSKATRRARSIVASPRLISTAQRCPLGSSRTRSTSTFGRGAVETCFGTLRDDSQHVLDNEPFPTESGNRMAEDGFLVVQTQQRMHDSAIADVDLGRLDQALSDVGVVGWQPVQPSAKTCKTGIQCLICKLSPVSAMSQSPMTGQCNESHTHTNAPRSSASPPCDKLGNAVTARCSPSKLKSRALTSCTRCNP